jgi:hypothetical protein
VLEVVAGVRGTSGAPRSNVGCTPSMLPVRARAPWSRTSAHLSQVFWRRIVGDARSTICRRCPDQPLWGGMTGRLRRPDLGAAGGGGRLDLTAGLCVSLRQTRPVSLFPQVSRRSRRSEAEPHWCYGPWRTSRSDDVDGSGRGDAESQGSETGGRLMRASPRSSHDSRG